MFLVTGSHSSVTLRHLNVLWTQLWPMPDGIYPGSFWIWFRSWSSANSNITFANCTFLWLQRHYHCHQGLRCVCREEKLQKQKDKCSCYYTFKLKCFRNLTELNAQVSVVQLDFFMVVFFFFFSLGDNQQSELMALSPAWYALSLQMYFTHIDQTLENVFCRKYISYCSNSAGQQTVFNYSKKKCT